MEILVKNPKFHRKSKLVEILDKNRNSGHKSQFYENNKKYGQKFFLTKNINYDQIKKF